MIDSLLSRAVLAVVVTQTPLQALGSQTGVIGVGVVLVLLFVLLLLAVGWLSPLLHPIMAVNKIPIAITRVMFFIFQQYLKMKLYKKYESQI
jgi:hypothetical protein